MPIRRIPAPIQKEDYSSLATFIILLSLALMVIFGLYWISEQSRLSEAEELLQEERIAHAEKIYADQCASCHGLAGEGGVGPALNDRTVLKNTLDGVFYSVIRSGVPNTQMPAWSVDFGGPLTDEDIRSLVAFIRIWETQENTGSAPAGGGW